MKFLIARMVAVFRRERVEYGRMCLDLALAKKREFDRLDPSDRTRSRVAAELLDVALNGIGGVLGNEVLAAAYGPDPLPHAGRDDHLSALWHRLSFSNVLFSGVASDGPSAISALRDELLAVANGDAPVLLARLPGAGKNGASAARFKVLMAKLEVLKWKAFIKSDKCLVKVPIGLFNSWVKIGFDASAASDWREQAIEGLGAENVEIALRWAGRMWMQLPTFYTVNDLEEAVRRSAAAVVEAERRDEG